MTRPDRVQGWPVRWEPRHREDDDATTIGGLTAVVDGARLTRPPVLLLSTLTRTIRLSVDPVDIDGEPLDGLHGVARAIVRDLSMELVP